MLELKNVHSYYGRSHALHGIDLRVPAGQVTAVLGRNGMGKTTLLRTLVGSLVHSTGAILLDGVIVEDDVMIGAGSLVPPGKRLEAGFLYMGNPVKQARPLKPAEIAFLKTSADNYVLLKDEYLQEA